MRLLDRFKKAVSYIPGTVRLYHFFLGRRVVRAEGVPRSPLERGPLPGVDLKGLSRSYQQSPLSKEPDSFVLYRIIGNDLAPRHRPGQSRENLRFILEHESSFPNCTKRFVVNRIADSKEEQAILHLLDGAGTCYLHIPFRLEEYEKIPWDIEGIPLQYAPYTRRFSNMNPAEQDRVLMRICRHRNNYVMHNNGARNAALAQGRRLAKWVLPWDGNCFITPNAWQNISESVRARPHLPYFLVPMARITDNRLLLCPQFHPDPVEEPQILFRRDSTLCFNEAFFYGRRPKVELLWRLGAPGDWDQWTLEPWDLPGPKYDPMAGAFGRAGWVARLDSGQAQMETDPVMGKVDRGIARNDAIRRVLDSLDLALANGRPDKGLCFYKNPMGPLGSTAASRNRLLSLLLQNAEQALLRGPYSVVHKSTLAPSSDPHDYWHPSPYYWPNPLTPSGRPYVFRDGRRAPGTRLYEPDSEQYDRTRLQRLFDDTLILALAWRYSGDSRFSNHAAFLVRTWFLDSATAMKPNLAYAQVRIGHNDDQGSPSGIIEMKDLYFFLDAVKVLEMGKALSEVEQNGFRDWLQKYLHWLRTSLQGRKERAAKNNHGLYYDLQVGAIANFLNKELLLRDTLRDSRFRILAHFDARGRQPEEMRRTTTAHYCCFNLQGWIHLAMLAESCGEDLWHFQGKDGRGIRAGMAWLLSHLGREWPYEQIDAFDVERFYPIYYACKDRYELPPEIPDVMVPEPNEVKPLFFPHDGIRPFWQFGGEHYITMPV